MEAITLTDLLSPATLILNLWSMVLTVFFFYSFLTPKDRFRNSAAFALTFLISVIMQIAPMLLFSHMLVKLAIYVFLYTFLLGIIYQNSFLFRIVIVSFSLVIVFVMEAVCAGIVVSLFGISSAPLMKENDEILIRALPVTLSVCALTFGVPCLIGRRLTRKPSDPFLLRFLILPVSQIVLLSGANISMMYPGRSFSLTDTVILITMGIVSIAADVVFFRLSREVLHRQDQQLQLTVLQKHYNALSEQQRSIRVMRHDISNHLMTAQILAREDSAKASRYIGTLSDEYARMTSVGYCENQIVDAVLYGKSVEAASRGISFSVQAELPEGAAVDELDLMSLLSNLLDNAIETAAGSAGRSVSVNLRNEPDTIILCVNCSCQNDQTSGPFRNSTEKHYLSIANAEALCKKYHGSLVVKREEETLSSVAVLFVNK